MMNLPESKLAKNQEKVFRKEFSDSEGRWVITAKVRFDDRCSNGHNSFSITGDLIGPRGYRVGGCIHEEIAKHFPELQPYLKWHLCSADGPLHYIANTTYHAADAIPESMWDFWRDKKVDLEAARRSAIWPDATLEQLRDEEILKNRLPSLLQEFKMAVESLGLEY